jgi:hypothetical protein
MLSDFTEFSEENEITEALAPDGASRFMSPCFGRCPARHRGCQQTVERTLAWRDSLIERRTVLVAVKDASRRASAVA